MLVLLNYDNMENDISTDTGETAVLPGEGGARLNQAVSLSDLWSAVAKSRLDVWN